MVNELSELTQVKRGSMDQIATEIKAALYDRIGDKFFRSFIFLSFIYNWKILSAAVNCSDC